MKLTIIILALAALTVAPASAQSANLRVLHNFAAYGSSNDGSIPYGPLVLDSKGNLYGVTYVGGTVPCGTDYGCGTVFQLSPGPDENWKETILLSFTDGNDGGFPWGGLVFDASGDFYGTLVGGPDALGGVFEMSPLKNGWSYDIIYTDGTGLGAGPGLLLGDAGDFYGSIGIGDVHEGAIGELSPGSSGWAYTQLYSFCNSDGCPNGYGPAAPPIWDKRGDLWGVTTYGGTANSGCMGPQGCGVIFAMTPNGDGTWNYHVMHRFAASIYDGQRPYGGLVMDSAGNFYGGTWLGGPYNNGTVFKFGLVDGKWKETILYDFPDCRDGCQVDGTLAMDNAGNLYGTASGGTGECDGLSCGVVFRLAPQPTGQWRYTKLYDLNVTSGGVSPFYGVILDGKGNLYGVTSSFGQYGGGTAFEISP